MFGSSWRKPTFEDYLKDEGSLAMSGGDRYEEKKRKLERAKEIADGTTLGTFERDDEVWDLVNRIEQEEI